MRNSSAGRRSPCYQCGRMGHIASECRSTSGNGRRMNYRHRQTENYCFVCGQVGHFARECQFRFQSPINSQPRQDNVALPINCVQPTVVFIKARLGGHERKCLVDTGATVSLVSREFISGPLKPCSLRARGIGGGGGGPTCVGINGLACLPWDVEGVPSVSGRGYEKHLYFGC